MQRRLDHVEEPECAAMSQNPLDLPVIARSGSNVAIYPRRHCEERSNVAIYPRRHCEERSDVAIQMISLKAFLMAGLPRLGLPWTLPARAQHSATLHIKIGLLASVLIAVPAGHAEELGRLFLTPQQRAMLERGQQLNIEKPVIESLTVSGIVQRHGGERTVWINGVPQIPGKSDERAPESVPVTLPGQAQPVRLKVGQKVLLDRVPEHKPAPPHPPNTGNNDD